MYQQLKLIDHVVISNREENGSHWKHTVTTVFVIFVVSVMLVKIQAFVSEQKQSESCTSTRSRFQIV